jgi:hypothetical protein
VVTAASIREPTLLTPHPFKSSHPLSKWTLKLRFSCFPQRKVRGTFPAARTSRPTSPTPGISTLLFLRSLISLRIYKENLCGYVGVGFFLGRVGGEVGNNEAQRELMYCATSEWQNTLDTENCFLLFSWTFFIPLLIILHTLRHFFISLDSAPHFQNFFFLFFTPVLPFPINAEHETYVCLIQSNRSF